MSSISLGSTRRGATLPLTVIVLALMAVGLAMTYSRISSERVINSDLQAQQGAFAVAQSGLNRYLSTLNAKPPAAGPWPITVTYNDLPQGTAQVVMQQLRDSTTTLLPALYVISSTGRYTAARRYNSLTPSAERTVATFAMWVPAPVDIDAAITSLGGMNKAGGAGNMNGVDACGVQAAIAGVALASGAGVGGTNYTGATGPIDGNPDNTPVSLGTNGPGGTAKDQVKIDWNGIVNNNLLPADFVYPTWPTAAQLLQWPVVRVNNSGGAAFDLPSNGQGVLIVTGDLTISGSNTWQGLILVGGAVTSNGSNNNRGSVIAGLNTKLGQVVGPSTMNGTKSYQFDSCALTRAMGHIGSIQRIRNGWTDTWSSY